MARLGAGEGGRIYWVSESREVSSLLLCLRGWRAVPASQVGHVNNVSPGQRRGLQPVVGRTSGCQLVFCWNCVGAGSTGDTSSECGERRRPL